MEQKEKRERKEETVQEFLWKKKNHTFGTTLSKLYLNNARTGRLLSTSSSCIPFRELQRRAPNTRAKLPNTTHMPIIRFLAHSCGRAWRASTHTESHDTHTHTISMCTHPVFPFFFLLADVKSKCFFLLRKKSSIHHANGDNQLFCSQEGGIASRDSSRYCQSFANFVPS